MATRLIVRESSGSIQSYLHRPNVVVPEPAGPLQPFASPFSPQEMEDLRWYLEDYLQAPYAVYEERSAVMQAKIDEWGVRLFDTLFGQGKPGRDAYLRARSAGEWSLWLASDSPAFLALPWELMRDPVYPAPLALDVAVNRTIDVQEAPASVSGEELRVLMVIARPEGDRDAGYRVIARSLVERLPAVSGRVRLDVVRPPTLDEFRRRLEQARAEGQPYQVVHFDGHGAFGDSAAGGGVGHLQFGQGKPRGFLLFEKETGGADLVPAEDFGAVLRGAGVPLLVFNACRSATLADVGAPEAAVATRVLHAGAAAVVAMSYSVYVVAAAEFMAAFYEALFQGMTVEEAVRAGRRQMNRADQRPSPKGMLPLDDWMVPVHYARTEVRFPQLMREPVEGGSSLEALLARMRPQAVAAAESEAGLHVEGSLEPAGGVFVGRDWDFLRLEAALRHHRVMVLHGMGGTGKTELAKAFARWLRDTGGLDDPRLVFFHSFEPGIATFGLSGVVTAIGLRCFGPDFVRYFPDTARRAEAILRFLRDYRALLVWDNFETVFSMPDPTGTTPPLGEAERREVRDFLAGMARSSKSGVIITSRSPEAWLGEVHRMEVGGLDRNDAVQYADVLLTPHPAAQPRRKERAFGELLEALGGHPLSMRLTLPHLERSNAAVLLQSLREAGPEAGSVDNLVNRLASLGACIHYSFQHIPEGDRRLLPALTLFEGVVDADMLIFIGENSAAPKRFRKVGRELWKEALARCVGVGLLTPLGAGLYRIHPALPPYLDGLWREQAASDYAAEMTAARCAGAWACSVLGDWAMSQINGGNAELAFAVVRQLRRTFGRMALASIESREFAQVQQILQPLFDVLEADGNFVELRAWGDRCRDAIEGPFGEVPDPDSDAGALWFFVVGMEANRALLSGDLTGAESTYQRIAELLRNCPAESAQSHLAGTYHQLGIVAAERGDLSLAEEWHREALAISEELGDVSVMMLSYHHLGIVSQNRGDLTAAEKWYRKSLVIEERLGNRPGLASTYHQLGIVAQKQGDLSTAEEWYRKSLVIEEELGNRPGLAGSYHQLGRVAQERGDLFAAEEWYRRALVVKEELGNRSAMASTYHQLGSVAQARGDFSAAEEWYRKSLAINEELGDRPGLALTFGQIGVLEEQRKRPDIALELMVRCVALFPEFPHPLTGPAPYHLVRLTRILGIPTLEAAWERVTGASLPASIREPVALAVMQLERTEAGDAIDD